LQEHIATPSTTIVTNGVLKVPHDGDPTHFDPLPDWSNLGTLDFRRAVAMSSDVYFYCLAAGCSQLPGGIQGAGLGPNRIARYARTFGLGELTGIDLPSEVTGTVPDPKPGQTWYKGDTYFYGIGQSDLTVTPLQMLRVVAAIANGGSILRPHIVHEIRDAKGDLVTQNEPQVERHVDISPENLQVMREGMLGVVENGSAPGAKVPGLQIAGKSGTAEFGARLSTTHAGEAANGSYSEHGWFVSFAPYDNPQVALVVFHDRGGGALTAAPTSAKIWDYYFRQYLPSHPASAATANANQSAQP
ncbi:MAG: penicillin-binding transpeptidase domain-containing protein, partial [Dehalococcoidia bacterium]